MITYSIVRWGQGHKDRNKGDILVSARSVPDAYEVPKDVQLLS